jgi:tetratricopeptide (TPR) repeat protein
MKQIDDIMNKDNRPYYAAAAYYFDNGKDLTKASEWIDKAIAANPQAFWMTLLKARINAKMGDKAGALAMCDKTIELATAAKNDDYIKMATDLKATLK